MPSEYLQRINERIAPEALRRFVSKSGDYGDAHEHLGPRGQFADIWRKVGKLKRALWDGVPMQYESPIEMCYDLIGHCYLTIDMLERQEDSDERKCDAELFG